jgi:hypothetical protein
VRNDGADPGTTTHQARERMSKDPNRPLSEE